ncbi:hypothetical protein [uncultured Pelagimonas sp.]|uniref:hypothetical protein n=1 Tax=uncultured Pelagimonas sp. TaxID=1618102 RepID=UPI00263018E1|nr:hypothetical protein [uncultured Pelagimonas sp.]
MTDQTESDIPHLQSEALFYGTRYSTSGGTKLTMQMPDRELADALDALGAGKRFMMVLVPINDEEEPDEDAMQALEEGKARIKRAVLLCDDKAFWDWAEEIRGGRLVQSKDEAKAALCELLAIKSRAEIKGAKVGANFLRLEEDFKVWCGRLKRPE